MSSAAVIVVVTLLMMSIPDTCYGVNPTFSSTSQDMAVFEGDTVEIRCSVSNLPSYLMVFWLNNSMVISSGRTVFVSNNRRTSIEGQDSSYNLKIRDVREWDDGNYTCQVPGAYPIMQQNRLIVKKPPSIQTVYPGTRVEVRERESLQLECRATGRPRPTVTWTRQDQGMLPNGRYSDASELLTVYNMQRHASGIYICTANNGVGKPANVSISVIVQYSPVVNVTSETVYTGPSRPVSLECTVQAVPEAELNWFHNNSEITPEYARRKNIKKGKQRVNETAFKYQLEIASLQPRDLGIYKCEARNDLGFGYKIITLSAFPHNVKIFSSQYSHYRDQYTIQWQVTSYSPVLDFVLYLKQINETWDTQWVHYNIPAAAGSHQSTHTQEYNLRGLVADSDYLVTIRARNAYGDGPDSAQFQFRTADGIRSAVCQPSVVLLGLALLVLLKHSQ